MKKLSERVIGCAVEVSRTLRNGFLERVYENALALEMDVAGIAYERQKPLAVTYRERSVGEYVCDFLVEQKLLLEIKAVPALLKEHEWQVLNYLRATGATVGLLLNFGKPRLETRRLVLDYKDDETV